MYSARSKTEDEEISSLAAQMDPPVNMLVQMLANVASMSMSRKCGNRVICMTIYKHVTSPCDDNWVYWGEN